MTVSYWALTQVQNTYRILFLFPFCYIENYSYSSCVIILLFGSHNNLFIEFPCSFVLLRFTLADVFIQTLNGVFLFVAHTTSFLPVTYSYITDFLPTLMASASPIYYIAPKIQILFVTISLKQKKVRKSLPLDEFYPKTVIRIKLRWPLLRRT